MGTEQIGFIAACVAAIAAIIAAVVAAKAQQGVERMKVQFRHFEEIETLKRRYSTPLLKSAEELYNKLNDVVRNRFRTCRYFTKLPDSIVNIRSIGDVLSSDTTVYLASVLYLFARYFASIEAIKKDVGLLQLASDEETRALQRRLRQTVAVFFSGRSLKDFKIREAHSLKYRGVIMEGAQVLIGESMLIEKDGTHECISFYEFCSKIATDKDFRQCLSPLFNFLGGLQEVRGITYESDDIDFRWPKLIIFASFLRELIRQIDIAKVMTLLPELEQYEQKYIAEHDDIRKNLEGFRVAHPDP